jgi:transcriptional regulator with XRE-family HTH domain
MRRKYFFTPEIDERIRRVYRHKTGNSEVTELAQRLGMPSYTISRRAREINAYEPKIKESRWSSKEIEILTKNAHKSLQIIRKHLKKRGFTRSFTGIHLKRRRLRLLKNLSGYTARQLAECFGCDVKTITRWINLGYLKAKKRGTLRTEKQGGDMWWIKEKNIQNFIKENIGLIDIRKVDKFWFVDILCGGLTHKVNP